MQCNEIREMLSAYIDGVLDEQETSELEIHIRTCSLCHQELNALRETVKLLNSLGEVDPPGEFRSQLLQKLKVANEEAGGKKVHGVGPKSFKFRQLFGGINKYLTAAVLMIGLGIGTGLYQAGALTVSQSFDFSAKTSQESQVARGSERSMQKTFEAAAPQIASNVPKDSGGGSAEIAEAPAAESKDRAPLDTGMTSQPPADVSMTGQAEDKQDGQVQQYSILPAEGTVEKSTEKSTEQSPVRSNETPPEEAREKTLSSPVSNEARSQADSTARSLPAAKEAQPARDSVMLAQKNDSPVSMPVEVKSDDGLSQQAGWVLPGVLTALGIGLAGYYAGLRGSKKS